MIFTPEGFFSSPSHLRVRKSLSVATKWNISFNVDGIEGGFHFLRCTPLVTRPGRAEVQFPNSATQTFRMLHTMKPHTTNETVEKPGFRMPRRPNLQFFEVRVESGIQFVFSCWKPVCTVLSGLNIGLSQGFLFAVRTFYRPSP